MNPFEQLIKELGLILDLPLKPDSHSVCLLSFEEGVAVQIEHDEHRDRILLGSQLGKINTGPYREKIFKEALKVNGTLELSKGVLAYSEKSGSLILFNFLPFATLNGQLLAQFLESFLIEVRLWVDALKRGEVPRFEESGFGGGMFGLRL